MIDLETEPLLTLAQAARSLPGGGSVNISTIHRWRLRGSRGVKLETVLRGGVRYTSAEAIRRFIEQTTEAADGPAVRNAPQRKRAVAAAVKQLDAAGI